MSVLSKKAQKRLSSCFQWLLSISNVKTVYERKSQKNFYFKLNFITLTLPSLQMHSDSYIKSHCLEPFLKWMSRNYTAHSYIWKAEAQQNGNLHFHITANKFIHWRAVRLKWNSLLQNHGYLDNYTEEQLIKNVPSTEIKAVVKVNKIVAYIVKYFTKKDELKSYVSLDCPVNNGLYNKLNFNWITDRNGFTWEKKRNVTGKIWSASHNLVQSSLVLEQGTNDFDIYNNFLYKEENLPMEQKDWCTIFHHKPDTHNRFPIEIKRQLHEKINGLRKADEMQIRIEVDSLR